ncbi:MAG: ABC-ATPase domain-containing protein [Myxococcota bacterium]
MPGSLELAKTLERINGRGYKAYRDIEGHWAFSEWDLFVDRVQSDPFASPSKLRARVSLPLARIPDDTFADDSAGRPTRRIATAAWFARAFRKAIRAAAPQRSGTGKGGLITIDAGGPEVLERTAIIFGENAGGEGFIEARFEVGLPADGRRVRGGDAITLLVETLPKIVCQTFIDRDAKGDAELRHFVDCVENQESIRAQLADHDLIAFVGDGSVLPRATGASEAPMAGGDALAFESPVAFRVALDVPHADAGAPGNRWSGMGIPRGVTLLVGGGYHGKSTLLRAIERSVIPHVPGDGRETVVSDPALVKIRAEDGRSVSGVDIQTFIDRLPLRPGESEPRNTRHFSTDDASGSTSQAANLSEAIEVGASGLLLDEDTCATNFMVRDARMQALIHPRDEPITPFLHRVRALYEEFDLSTLLVMGGSGDYFSVADTVIEMKAYRPLDVTARAQALAGPSEEAGDEDVDERFLAPVRRPLPRVPVPESFEARRGRKEVKISSRACEEIVYGTTEIDLRSVEQLFDPSQTRAIGAAIHLAATQIMTKELSLADVLDALEAILDAKGLDVLDPFGRPGEASGRHPGAFARPRRFEIAAALNRMRTLSVETRAAD